MPTHYLRADLLKSLQCPILESKFWKNIFRMAAIPFPCNCILLFQGNLPRVTQVVFQMYRNFMLVFLSPISSFNLCLWGMVKLSVLNILRMHFCVPQLVSYSDPHCIMHQKEKDKITHEHDLIFRQIKLHNIHLHLEFCHSLQWYHCLFFHLW